MKSSRIKKLCVLAMLAAIAYVVMMVGRIPVVAFLKYDPKDIIITIAGFLFGAPSALAVSFVVSLIEMLTLSDTGIIGFFMNVLSTASFASTIAIFDALMMGIMEEKNYALSDFALIHPGGAVGKKIN